MKSENKINERVGKVGGQAVLEGVMMKGKDHYAIAVRREDGTVSLCRHDYVSIRSKHKILGLPLIRGIVGFVESMMLSFKTLSYSAEQYGEIDEEPETKFEKWLMKHFGDKLMNIVMIFSTLLGVALAIGLFLLLPSAVTKGLERLFGSFGWFKNLIEGIIKIAIFVGYILLVSLMKDIKRTFQYHGAEHKSIFCYESGDELTVENVRRHSRFHPRCGTSFIFVMLIIGILINSLPFVSWNNLFLRMLTKLLLLPIIVGVGFEFIMFAGKHDNLFTKILSAPGLWMQRITTKEPDDGMIECAIMSLKSALPEQFPDFVYNDPHDNIAENENETDQAVNGLGSTDISSENAEKAHE